MSFKSFVEVLSTLPFLLQQAPLAFFIAFVTCISFTCIPFTFPPPLFLFSVSPLPQAAKAAAPRAEKARTRSQRNPSKVTPRDCGLRTAVATTAFGARNCEWEGAGRLTPYLLHAFSTAREPTRREARGRGGANTR